MLTRAHATRPTGGAKPVAVRAPVLLTLLDRGQNDVPGRSLAPPSETQSEHNVRHLHFEAFLCARRRAPTLSEVEDLNGMQGFAHPCARGNG